MNRLHCIAGDSHEMTNLIFSENKKKIESKMFMLLSVANATLGVNYFSTADQNRHMCRPS